MSRFTPLHSWEVNPEQAVEIQQTLRNRVICTDQLGPLRRIAGIDVGFEQDGTVTRAAVAVLSFPELQLLEKRLARRPTSFPYVPGLLSFREVPAILMALEQLEQLPDLLMVDGQGIAHPRRFGIASHLGVWCDLPAIGVAKSLLIGWHAPLGAEVGMQQPIHHGGEVIGMALRTRAGVKPVYVSIGHRLSLATAVQITLQCRGKFRLPEPTRQAHQLASAKEAEQASQMSLF